MVLGAAIGVVPQALTSGKARTLNAALGRLVPSNGIGPAPKRPGNAGFASWKLIGYPGIKLEVSAAEQVVGNGGRGLVLFPVGQGSVVGKAASSSTSERSRGRSRLVPTLDRRGGKLRR